MIVEQYDQLAVDIDTRLLPLWDQVFDAIDDVKGLQGQDARAVLGSAMRTAYAMGYAEALIEDKQGRRSALHKANGYKPL